MATTNTNSTKCGSRDGQLLLLPYTVLFWEWYELWTVLSGALAPLGWEWWLIKSLLLGLGH